MKSNGIIFCAILLTFVSAFAQESNEESNDSTQKRSTVAKTKIKGVFKKRDHTFNYNILSQLYPIRDNPSVGFRSSYTGKETIMFDVHPVLSLSLFNNFKRKLREGKLFSQGYSFNFRPQFRMYNEQSTPVKMPSYRVMVGLQHLYRVSEKHLVSYAIESGHYSNGQSGSALIGGGVDGTTESDSMWATITADSDLSDMINRKDGDFSTNLTELMVNYRYIPKLDKFSRPARIHSASAGVVLYHNNLFGVLDAGGYTPAAIDVYGKWRFLISYAYSHIWQSGYRLVFSENIEVIAGAHPSVNPLRSVASATFFLRQSLGFYLSYIYGHDDYNLRFVDSGHQFGAGLTWDMFPPIEIGRDQN